MTPPYREFASVKYSASVMFFSRAAASIRARTLSDAIIPGMTALTRMPSGANSRAAFFVKCASAAFGAE